MKRLIAISLIFLQACALNPAPITTLDVRQAIDNGTPSQTILTDIDLRCQALNKKRRNFNIAVYSFLWAPVALAGPIFLCQLPARKKTKAELLLMQEKRKEVLNERLDK